MGVVLPVARAGGARPRSAGWRSPDGTSSSIMGVRTGRIMGMNGWTGGAGPRSAVRWGPCGAGRRWPLGAGRAVRIRSAVRLMRRGYRSRTGGAGMPSAVRRRPGGAGSRRSLGSGHGRTAGRLTRVPAGAPGRRFRCVAHCARPGWARVLGRVRPVFRPGWLVTSLLRRFLCHVRFLSPVVVLGFRFMGAASFETTGGGS